MMTNDERPERDRTEASGSSPVRWVRERDVDLMLAESLATRLDFVDWFLEQVPKLKRQAEVVSCDAIVSFIRPDAEAGGTGETDVYAKVSWADGQRGELSIEDKVLASHQFEQGKRHSAYVSRPGVDFGAAVLVAPEAWMSSHPAEVQTYDASVTIESVAEWHEGADDPALGWRAKVFRKAAEQRHQFVPASDLESWDDGFDSIIRRHGLRLKPAKRQRSAAPGQGHSNRNLTVAFDALDDFGVLDAVLCFCSASANHPGRSSLAIEVAAEDPLDAFFEDRARQDGFETRRTPTARYVEVCPVEARWFSTATAVEDQEIAIRALVEGATRLQRWWNGLAAT